MHAWQCVRRDVSLADSRTRSEMTATALLLQLQQQQLLLLLLLQSFGSSEPATVAASAPT
jgi:hypothetical protein